MQQSDVPDMDRIHLDLDNKERIAPGLCVCPHLYAYMHKRVFVCVHMIALFTPSACG